MEEKPQRVQKLDHFFSKLSDNEIFTQSKNSSISLEYLQKNIFANQPRFAVKFFKWMENFSPNPSLATLRESIEILILETEHISNKSFQEQRLPIIEATIWVF